MKLLSYNIQYGFGADGIYDLTRTAHVINGADIVALQEVERHWARSNHDDQPAILERLLPQYYTAYGPAFDMDASQHDGNRVINRRRQFGTMILSRWPIVWTRLHLLPMRRMISPLNTQNPALEAMIVTPLGPIRVLSIHLAHVGVQERLEQIDHLLALHARTALSGPPWSGTDDEPARNWTESQPEPPCPETAIWLGDFNSEPGSGEHARITGQTPYHPGARYAQGFSDAVAHLGIRLHTHEKIKKSSQAQKGCGSWTIALSRPIWCRTCAMPPPTRRKPPRIICPCGLNWHRKGGPALPKPPSVFHIGTNILAEGS